MLAAALPFISAGASILGGLSGLKKSSSGSGSGSVPAGYQPTGMGTADTMYQGLADSLNNNALSLGAQYMPAFHAQTDAIINNPYGAQAQGGMDAASAYALGGLAPMQQQGAQALMGLGNMGGQWAGSVQPWAERIMQTAFDPQQALYDRNYQQMLDRQNAINAMNGIASTPYGAGVTGQTATNFDLDWQDRQLGRQTQGAGAYANLGSLFNSLSSGAGSAFGQASDLGSAAYGTMQSGAMLPYQTFLGQRGDNLAALGAMLGAQGTINDEQGALMQMLSTYMNAGTNASQGARAADNTNYARGQEAGSQLGGGLSALASLLGGRQSSPMSSLVGLF